MKRTPVEMSLNDAAVTNEGAVKTKTKKKVEQKKVEPKKVEPKKVDVQKVESEKVESKKIKQKSKTTHNDNVQLKPWQRKTKDGRIVDTIVFMSKEVEYTPGMRHRYKFPSLRDGLDRVVTARYPKGDKPENVNEITYMGYDLRIEKYGANVVVCKLEKDGEVIANYVSLATVIDILQDLLNPDDKCTISWGTIDQSIKLKRGLKSRIKRLTASDMPSGRVKSYIENIAEGTTEKNKK